MKKNRTFLVFVVMSWFALMVTSCAATNDDFWKGAKEWHPGILHKSIERDQPRLMKIQAMRIDLGTGLYGFTGTPKPAEWGKPMPDCPEYNIVTARQRTKAFMEECRKPVKDGGKGLDMVVAVNAAPWKPWKKPWNHKFAAVLGLVITDGEVLDSNDLGRPAFVSLKDGKVDFRSKTNPIDLKLIDMAAPGFAQVLTATVVNAGALKETYMAPRTGYGLSKDRRYFYIVTIDGRQKDYSLGCNTGEVGQLLKEMGAYDGLNMDGGGSTTLVVWDASKGNGEARILNHQSGGAQRTVGYSIGIYRKK